jgi:hypothetical protein
MHLKQSIDQTIAILDDVIVFDPSDNPRNKRQSGVPVHNKKRTKDLQYAFDRVLPGNCSQQQVSFYSSGMFQPG